MNLPIEYSDKAVSAHGGLAVMKEFLDKVNIREQLGELDLPQPGSNRGYSGEQIVESFWLSIWAGASRYTHCNLLRHDDVLREVFGFRELPSQSTYSRFFGKFSQARNTAVFPKLQQWFFSQMNIGKLTIDFDSTVITREGKQQEGAAIGYNPNRRGRNSHHPLIAFCSENRMAVNAWLRPGNTAACSNCEAFFDETFDEALKGQEVGLVRADSGFYTESLLSKLEDKNLNYIIAAKAYSTVKYEVHALTDWVGIDEGIDVCEFSHQSQMKGSKARRHFVVRKQIQRRPEASGKLLFEDLPNYRYSIYVTNLDLPLKEIWNVYNGRAECENRIKELKENFGIASFCLKDFWACEASFRWSLVAYNLMMLFQHLALNGKQKHSLATLRTQCFALGSWIVNHARSRVLKLALPQIRRPIMDKIRERIRHISAPFPIPTA